MSTDRAPDEPREGSAKGADANWPALAGLVVVAYGAAIAIMGGLGFPQYRDEVQFWEATQFFSTSWPPTLEMLRSYPEPMTPLAFLVWGAADVILDAGLAGPRAATVMISIALVFLVGARRGSVGVLAALGLVLFPYMLPLSIHLYTDVPAAFLVVLGFWLHARGLPIASALALMAAIATRQYMVAFAAALAASEAFSRIAPPGGSLAQWRDTWCAPVIAPALAAASYAGWIWFFGGLAPEAGLEKWPRHVSAIAAPSPAYGLYFLSCLGAYFVVIEAVLFRSADAFRALATRRAMAVGAVLVVAFVFFSPAAQGVTLGAMNRVAMVLLPPEVMGAGSIVLRSVLYGLLAWLACIRLLRVDLVGWLILANLALMTVSFEGWEKYALPMIAVLWLLRSFDPLDRPVLLWRRL